MQLGPLLLLSIPGGVLADRVSKQKLQLTMQGSSAILTLVIAYCIASHAALWTLFATQLLIGVANALERAGIPVVDAAARPSSGSARRDQPQLGDDERHPSRRAGARRAAVRRRDVGVGRVHRQRLHLPLLHRRAAVRAHARRQEHPRRQGLAPAGRRTAHRPRTARAQPAAARHVPLLAVQPRLHRALPVGRPPRVRHRGLEQHVPLAVRDLGHGRVPRRDLGRHRARPRRPPRAHRPRFRRRSGSSSPSSPRPAGRPSPSRSRRCSGSPTS